MSFISEMQRLQQNIKELAQTFEALQRQVEQYQNTRGEPEYPNELRDPDPVDLVDRDTPRKSIDDITPQEWNSLRFDRNSKS